MLLVLLFLPPVLGNLECDDDLKRLIGESESFTDLFGFEVKWSSKNDGWDEKNREDLLNLHVKNLQQPKWVPQLTEKGFAKTKMPAKLLEFLLEQRKTAKEKAEECLDSAHMNCYTYENGVKVKSNRTSLLEPKENKVFR